MQEANGRPQGPTKVPGAIDMVKNRQGEDLMDFLENTGMRIVNGRSGRDGFTCVPGRGSSVVDCCIV